ncbi:hypothetical protein D5086_004246 [Populus alba]|uniref:Uncharacterized protein n=1 Tax=Populus alba TaxID=43335 RepID=A0ACC4CQN0_POPAL
MAVRLTKCLNKGYGTSCLVPTAPLLTTLRRPVCRSSAFRSQISSIKTRGHLHGHGKLFINLCHWDSASHPEVPESIRTKRIFDQYQQTKGIDLWSSHYEIMKENLEKLKEVNMKIRREMRQRMGQCLNDLSFQDLQSLESDMESAWRVIHDRADRVLTNQIETSKKKVFLFDHLVLYIFFDVLLSWIFESLESISSYCSVKGEECGANQQKTSNGTSKKQWIKIHTAWVTMEGTTILLWDFEMKVLAYLLCDRNPTSLIFPGKQGHLSQLTPCLRLHPSCSIIHVLTVTNQLNGFAFKYL